MARIARVVAPGVPHHVTQRGNRRQKVFLGDDDYHAYRELLAEGCKKAGAKVWAYCLMPNHVHLILVPPDADGLRAALADAHRRYTRLMNEREGWHGHLWQQRFASFPMDESYVIACARYIEQNPVRAKLARRPRDWRWSSARAHLEGARDPLVDAKAMLDFVPDWAGLLRTPLRDEDRDAIRAGERTGRPLGSDRFIARLERKLDRPLKKRKAGRKPAAEKTPRK